MKPYNILFHIYILGGGGGGLKYDKKNNFFFWEVFLYDRSDSDIGVVSNKEGRIWASTYCAEYKIV
jgi:hypothetical protein